MSFIIPFEKFIWDHLTRNSFLLHIFYCLPKVSIMSWIHTNAKVFFLLPIFFQIHGILLCLLLSSLHPFKVGYFSKIETLGKSELGYSPPALNCSYPFPSKSLFAFLGCETFLTLPGAKSQVIASDKLKQ